MNARQLGDRVDEADIRGRPPRRTRPRTKDRPQHTDAGYGGVIAVDRGRFTCLVAAPGAVPASLADLAPGGDDGDRCQGPPARARLRGRRRHRAVGG